MAADVVIVGFETHRRLRDWIRRRVDRVKDVRMAGGMSLWCTGWVLVPGFEICGIRKEDLSCRLSGMEK